MQKEVEKIILEASKVLSGKKDVIRRILTAALSDGHILLDDVPGVGKTTLAVALKYSKYMMPIERAAVVSFQVLPMAGIIIKLFYR